MPFRYRLQKVLDFRIRKKEEQLQEVIKAKNEVDRVQGLADENNLEIAGVIKIMRTTSDFRMMDSYDKYLKHLYEKGEELKKQLQEAIRIMEEEKQKLVECEKEVKVLEKHKEKALEAYKEEEKKAENKQLSEVAVQKYFQKTRARKEEEGED
ncbi:MAG: flagellar FliJ family protein [Candidatus Gastranaerophilales bacterium]|nr:flagellar FliJ family protein [Candidatus Gastranaerophilales bacterium]